MNWKTLAISALWALGCAPAQAGVYSDSLGKCLVTKTSDQDKAAFVRWIFASLSASPTVKDLGNVSVRQHDEIDLDTARLVDRLILTDCRKEAVEAMKYEGPSSFEAGFGVLGQVATRTLISDPVVNESMMAFAKHMNKADWDAMAKEAGIPPSVPAGK